MQLIYRGHSYTYTLGERTAVRPHPQSSQSDSIYDRKPAHQPRAINWRYQLPGVAQVEILPLNCSTADRSAQPRAINWRYQIPTEG